MSLQTIRDAIALLRAVCAVSTGRAERIAAPGKFRVSREPSGALIIEVMP